MRKNRRANPVFGIMMFLAAAVIAGGLFFLAERTYYRHAYPVKYSEAIEEESAKNSLPPSLIYAVIRTESGFNPSAQSSVGAYGLMQITEDTLNWIAWRLGEEADYDELLDGRFNIRYGSALLRLYIAEFGAYENVLCAYHAGRGRALEWLANPNHAPDGEVITHIPYGDTERYVKKVTETRNIYRLLYDME